MGFEKIIDVLILIWNTIWPWEVVAVYQGGVRLRLGNLSKVMTSTNGIRLPKLEVATANIEGWNIKYLRPAWTEPTGFHWTIPLIDTVLGEVIVPTPHNLNAQSLTTSDGRSVMVSFIVTASITDIEKALLQVEGVKGAINDASYGAIGTVTHKYTWDDMFTPEYTEEATKEIRARAKEMGIKIHRVQIADITASRTYRLVMGQ